jgi:hypothetical protein
MDAAMNKSAPVTPQRPEDDGPMVLGHEAVAGYRPIFYVCITIGILYLAFVFWQTW